MNTKDIYNSNNHLLNLPSQRTVTIENRLLCVGNIIHCPSRATNANILKISAEDNATIQFYAQDFPACRFASNLLQLETSKPYTVKG